MALHCDPLAFSKLHLSTSWSGHSSSLLTGSGLDGFIGIGFEGRITGGSGSFGGSLFTGGRTGGDGSFGGDFAPGG